MTDHKPPIPPWEPIADWLDRLNDHEAKGPGKTQRQIREEYEQEAKAIAYDIAMHNWERSAFNPERERLLSEIRELIDDD